MVAGVGGDGSGSAQVFGLSGEDEQDQAAWLERVGSGEWFWRRPVGGLLLLLGGEHPE